MLEMRSEKLDLWKADHIKVIIEIYQKNKNAFCFRDDDSLNDIISYLNASIESGDIGFLFYVNDKPYGIISASFDRHNNAEILAATLNNHNFFVSHKILKYFLDYLFDVRQINKAKAELFLWNKNSEIALKSIGFKKEGILKHEVTKNGKPASLLLLGLTKADYLQIKHKNKTDRENLKKLIRIIKNEFRKKQETKL